MWARAKMPTSKKKNSSKKPTRPKTPQKPNGSGPTHGLSSST